MKTRFWNLLLIAMLAVGVASCNKDADGGSGGGNVIEGEGGLTQLMITDAVPATYASTSTQSPETGESDIASTLAVFVFDNDGVLEYANASLSYNTSTKLTGTFKITSGNKYFYIFSNLPGSVTVPTTGTTRANFEQQMVDAAIASGGSNPATIATLNSFLIGTLWGEQTGVSGTGTETTPERIQLNIGRVASKVWLKTVTSTASGSLKGSFDNQPIYRLGSVPTKFYIVGQYTGSTPPAQGTQVKSAVHNEAPGTSASPNPLFVKYPWEAATNLTKKYYTVENTSAKINDNLYYGNTTYIQMMIKYKPAAEELYDGTTGDPTGAELPGANNGTFWTAPYNGSVKIFASDPTSLSGVGSPINEYAEGKNYYHFPIKDESETSIEKQCSVIRNHYYEVAVNTISRLGNPTDVIDPEEPIDEDAEVEVQVTVLDWSKIEQGVDL